MPPVGQIENARLPDNFQSVGSRGVNSLEGQILQAMFQPGTPWYIIEPAATVRYDPRANPEDIQRIKGLLALQEFVIQALLEAGGKSTRGTNRRVGGFRSNKRIAISQVLITGDVLEKMDDDYRIRVFRRDQYVTKRDSNGDVLYHMTHETIDPLSLTDEQIVKAQFDQQVFEEQDSSKRCKKLYTKVEWHPTSKKWVIEQECNGQIINESQETVTPYFSTPFELVPGENYGRGFVDHNRGDLRSLDTLKEKLLDFAAMASKHHPVLDMGSEITDEALEQQSGKPIREARVVNGVVQDIGFLKVDKINDFSVVQQQAVQLADELGKAMLLGSESVRNSERTTAYEVANVNIREIESSLGAFYAPLADSMQVPTIERAIFQAQRDKKILHFHRDDVDIEVLTGIAALVRIEKARKMTDFLGVVAQFGDLALSKINISTVVDVMARYQGIDEAGIVKSDEQVAQEQAQALQQQAASEATSEAIRTAGAVTEAQATQGA